MDQVHRGPLTNSPQSSSAESDNAQAPQRIPAPSRDMRNQHNEHGREIVTNVSDLRVEHYSPAAFEADSPPRREGRRRSESTSANPRPSAVATYLDRTVESESSLRREGDQMPRRRRSESTSDNPRPGAAATYLDRTAIPQRQTASTGQYDQQKYRQTEQRVQKLTNSDPHSFVSTAQPLHNGFHRVDIAAGTAQVEETIQRSFKQVGMLHKMQYDRFLQGMNERVAVLEDLDRNFQWYINAFHQVNHEKEEVIREKERMAYERKRMQEQVKDLQDEVARLQQKLQVQNRKPVVSVNSYSTHTADGASGADVIGAVQHLNEEIFQFAALLADEYQELREECRKLSWEDTTMRDMENTFGYTIAKFVSRAKKKGEHSWIEHALQTCIISCCMGSLTSLNPPYKGFKSSVDDLYNAIRSAEDQGVSGKWRSLACRHGLKRAKEKAKLLGRAISFLCEALGWAPWHPQSQHIDALESIISKTISLREMIYTEVLSGDIVVTFPEPGTPFDPGTMQINDSRNEHAKPTTGEPIICTTDMGLTKYVMEKSHSSDGKLKNRDHKTVILKAKVALRDSLPGDLNERAEVSQASRSHVARES
ncbi:hypothetical protein APHAL10511_003525 [Amanita phalloides]|nr:hypothetical protein APHAL10511_003525 [Amanita phalloides]